MAFIVFSFISGGYLFLFADKKIKFPASRALPLPGRRAGWSSSRTGQGGDWGCQRGNKAASAVHRNFGDALKTQQNPLVMGCKAGPPG